MVDIFIALKVGRAGRSSRAFGGAGPHFTSQASGCTDGTGSVNCSHAQVWAVIVLVDHVSDVAEGGPSSLVNGGLHVGGGRISLEGSALQDHHYTFPSAHQAPYPQSCSESAP